VLTLDGKGRITVPARHRDVLMSTVQGQLVVSKNTADCLTLFPRSVWDAFEASLGALPASHDRVKRLFIGSATDVAIDSASRVLIPPELREWAGLERDVIFMGMGNRFELWDKARYAAEEAKTREQDLSGLLSSLVIG
jgi:MraZ protein